MTTNMNNNLPALIKRLEAATNLLESIVTPNLGDASASTNGSTPNDEAVLAAGGRTHQQRGMTSSPQPISETLPPAIEDFDTIIAEDIRAFGDISEEIGGLVAEQSAAVLRAFTAERKFLIVTTKATKPDKQSQVYMEILKELQSTMGSVSDIRVANRGSAVFNHLTTVSEGIGLLGWVTMEPNPTDYISSILSSAQYHGNRVMVEYKEKDRTHVEWVQAFYNIFKSHEVYVKQHYPTGVTWNNQNGIDPQEALREVQSNSTNSKSSATAATSSGPAPPPPPPLPSFDNAPPPPPMPVNGGSSVPPGGGPSDMGAVFDQLSKGEAVTSRLRKVSPSSQTHKNPSLRTNAPVPTRSDSQNSISSRGKSSHPSKRPKPESLRTKKPPRKELDGNKWIIENFDSPDGALEIRAAISHSILISRCTNTTIRVLGKANAISLDNCTHCALVIDSLVSAVDVIKSPRFEMQVLGTLPTIMLDQVDGAAIYLSRESLGTEVFTSKCSGVNVNLPGRSDDDDYQERALPEQVRSVIRDGVVVSEIVEHSG
ncbi:hypothetical protein MMC07_007225 [Pseudocyphellaria aurata]|nr:hypothetical protein [Pseudocyphellaria aurata]